MSIYLVGGVYGLAFVLAVALLYFFSARWYWHVLSVAAALVVGLVRFPEGLQPPDLVLGFVFFFLFAWGVGGAVVRPRRRQLERHA